MTDRDPFAPLPVGYARIPNKGNIFIDPQIYGGSMSGTAIPWQAWTPSYTNLTVGNGTVVARYQQVGDGVRFYWSFDLGSTSVMGTSPGISLPVTASLPANDFPEDRNVIGQCIMRESGARTVYGVAALRSNTVMVPRLLFIVATLLEEINIAANVPWVWGTNDRLVMIGRCETA